MKRSLDFVSTQTCVYLPIIFEHVFNLMLQTEETVRRGPAGWRIDGHVQVLLHLLARANLGTVGLNLREKNSKTSKSVRKQS